MDNEVLILGETPCYHSNTLWPCIGLALSIFAFVALLIGSVAIALFEDSFDYLSILKKTGNNIERESCRAKIKRWLSMLIVFINNITPFAIGISAIALFCLFSLSIGYSLEEYKSLRCIGPQADDPYCDSLRAFKYQIPSILELISILGEISLSIYLFYEFQIKRADESSKLGNRIVCEYARSSPGGLVTCTLLDETIESFFPSYAIKNDLVKAKHGKMNYLFIDIVLLPMAKSPYKICDHIRNRIYDHLSRAFVHDTALSSSMNRETKYVFAVTYDKRSSVKFRILVTEERSQLGIRFLSFLKKFNSEAADEDESRPLISTFRLSIS